jgi:hypothetical protein
MTRFIANMATSKNIKSYLFRRETKNIQIYGNFLIRAICLPEIKGQQSSFGNGKTLQLCQKSAPTNLGFNLGSSRLISNEGLHGILPHKKIVGSGFKDVTGVAPISQATLPE